MDGCEILFLRYYNFYNFCVSAFQTIFIYKFSLHLIYYHPTLILYFYSLKNLTI